ncbi:PAS domain-containing protein [bacterium]|nr:MAG: PAS domain-containing protein [bacterium]
MSDAISPAVDTTDLLDSRPSRPPDHRSESEALRELVAALAEEPDHILQTLARVAMERCGGQSAGLNVEETDESGNRLVRCRATIGEYAAYLDRTTPRERSLCRIVIDRNATQLFMRPDRYDPSFANEAHPIVEILLAPVALGGRIVGTLWVVTHDEARQFDGEDRRMLETLAGFASVAWASHTAHEELKAKEIQAKKAQEESNRLDARVLAEQERLVSLVKDAPAFVAMLGGRELRFEYVNEAYYSLVGHRPVIGLTLHEALPEIEGQGFFEIMQEVMDTGIPFIVQERLALVQPVPDGPLEERFVNLVYQAARDSNGTVSGVLAHGVDITEQVRVRQAIAASEARYRTLFDSIEEGFVVLVMEFDENDHPIDYRFREFNDAFSQLTGIPAEWARDGVSAREAVPGLEEFWFQVYGRVALTGESTRFENQAEPMGKWFDVHAFRIGGEDSREVGVLFQDITSRRASDAALREANDLLERITDGTDELIVSLDPEFRFTRFNRAYARDFAKVFGREPRLGENLLGMLDHLPEDQANARAMWSRALSGENVDLTAEFGDPGRGRRFFDLRFYPLRDAEGEIVGAGEIARDVTERERLTAELRTEREKLQTLFELAPAFIAVLRGPDFVFEYVNEAYYALVGHRPIIGRALAEAIPETVGGDVGRDYDRILRKVLETGETVTYEARPVMLQRTPGARQEERFLDLSYQPLRETDGLITGVLVHGVDVTDQARSREELRRAEAALRVANQTLETKVVARTRELQETVREAEGFNYSISHDLRAPLRAIAATSSILIEDLGPKLDEESRRLLNRQVENAQRLGRLIDELLRLSRLARVPVNRVSLDITRKSQEIAAELEGCEVEVQEGMTAEGDPDLVRTVLQNLMGNACKFTPVEGTVRVTKEGDVITVSDEGIGFDMAYAHKIFLPFERLVTDAEFPGTGIGLANVERIVRRHGGRVWAESEPGKGSRFSFTLG